MLYNDKYRIIYKAFLMLDRKEWRFYSKGKIIDSHRQIYESMI